MRVAIVSYVMGDTSFNRAAVRWVHSLRKWQQFDGDILLFAEDDAEGLDELGDDVERHSIEWVRNDVLLSGITTNHDRGDIWLHKPFVLRRVLQLDRYDVVMMADVDSLAVRPLEPMFEAGRSKIFVPYGQLRRAGDIRTHNGHRGFFSTRERNLFHRRGMVPMCAAFTLGPPEIMKHLVDGWIETLRKGTYRKDGRPGMQEQSALNYYLFQHPELWELMPDWVQPFVLLVWQRPDPHVRIWHFYGGGLERQAELFARREKDEVLW